MNHGQFYRSGELVGLIHKNVGTFGGFHPGYRAVHADGRFYVGRFVPTPEAAGVSRAAHFTTPVPASVRFSFGSGDPEAPASPVVAMATRFYLPDGTVTDLIGITLPAFPVGTPDDVAGLLGAGAESPEALHEFVVSHPGSLRVLKLLGAQPAPTSFAHSSFRALHAFRFVDGAGDGVWARYHWEPEEGEAGMPVAEQAEQPRTYLYDELDERLAAGPASWRLELQLSAEGDSLTDISALWPEDRQRIVAGRLELVRAADPAELGDPVLMHDPTQVTDGIEVHPDDQVMSARRGAYLTSAAERTGGWQARAAALCPFGGTAG
ncbi:catalase [Streptomyces sp. NPDC048297]|uniref:catalase n=1 Tax=Streptomyces sp. NPDC048297 TaxID=3365531 RepID=UPI00371918EC